jgi:hypothetical protein
MNGDRDNHLFREARYESDGLFAVWDLTLYPFDELRMNGDRDNHLFREARYESSGLFSCLDFGKST